MVLGVFKQFSLGEDTSARQIGVGRRVRLHETALGQTVLTSSGPAMHDQPAGAGRAVCTPRAETADHDIDLHLSGAWGGALPAPAGLA